MLLTKLKISLVVLLAVAASAITPWETLPEIDKPDVNLQNFTQIQYWFPHQLKDHFDVDRTDLDVWTQRFWIVPDFFKKEMNPPVFVVICGMHSCPGTTKDTLFPLELAKEHGALVVVLEHRFYGLSQPFGKHNLTTDRLRLLNVDQALGDIAYFINWMTQSGNFTVDKDTKFITIGSGYAGALSAWFREKFPYLTVGAVASSPALSSIIDYDTFDEHVHRSLMRSGQKCVDTVKNLNRYVEELISDHGNALDVKKQFNAGRLTNEEFLLYWADIIGEIVSTGKRAMFCNLLENFRSVEAQFEAMKHYALNNTKPAGYSSFALSKGDYDPTIDGSRQAAWQSCSELGWFKTAAKNQSFSMRSHSLNLTFYRNWCEDIFQKKIWPIQGLANLKRGGKKLEATNLIIINGVEDPWQDTSITESKAPGVITHTVDCEDCGHSSELKTPSSEDAWSLWWVRLKVKRMVSGWLGQGWWKME